jgi:hypothetical protein
LNQSETLSANRIKLDRRRQAWSVAFVVIIHEEKVFSKDMADFGLFLDAGIGVSPNR